MDNFAEALAAIRTLKNEGLVSEYAIGGAMAATFWSEPTATYDLHMFVLLQSSGLLVDLEPIYSWARSNGYPEVDEHIVISDIPVQVLPAHNSLTEKAVVSAADLEYDGQPIRVIRPEYLVAMF